MPIDPRIPLMVQPVNVYGAIQDAVAQKRKAAMDAVSQQQEQQYNALRIQELQQKLGGTAGPDDAALMQEVLQETGGDWQQIPTALLKRGRIPEAIQFLKAADEHIKATQQPKQTEQGFTLSPGQTRYDAQGKPLATSEIPEKPAAPPQGFTLSPGQIRYDAEGKPLASAPKPQPTPVAGGSGGSDIREAVKGMKDGTLPPQMPGRASKDYTAIMAEAHRQGFDLAGAATDWAATQKHIASMNSNQQLRLNQSINQLPELLDSIDVLADKWKGGRFPLLNKANLALAKNGAWGPEVASVAVQLDAQIAHLTADLANVYMGGNSPTDHALDLAAKSLNASWDQKVLKDMTAMARKNVQIRRNSINNTGVEGASPNNPYAPQQQAAPVAAPSGGMGLTYQDYLARKKQ